MQTELFKTDQTAQANKPARAYTATLAICTTENKIRWHGSVDVEANNVGNAAVAGIEKAKAEQSHEPTDKFQILRVEAHAGVHITGEIDDLLEYAAEFSPDRL